MLSFFLSFSVLFVSASTSPLQYHNSGPLQYPITQDINKPTMFGIQAASPSTIPAEPEPDFSEEPLPTDEHGYELFGAIIAQPHGEYLGTVIYKTSAFLQKCQRCCRKSRRKGAGAFLFRTCRTCQLGRTSATVPGCPEGHRLGFTHNHGKCFKKRCNQLLRKASTSCGCL